MSSGTLASLASSVNSPMRESQRKLGKIEMFFIHRMGAGYGTSSLEKNFLNIATYYYGFKVLKKHENDLF